MLPLAVDTCRVNLAVLLGVISVATLLTRLRRLALISMVPKPLATETCRCLGGSAWRRQRCPGLSPLGPQGLVLIRLLTEARPLAPRARTQGRAAIGRVQGSWWPLPWKRSLQDCPWWGRDAIALSLICSGSLPPCWLQTCGSAAPGW